MIDGSAAAAAIGVIYHVDDRVGNEKDQFINPAAVGLVGFGGIQFPVIQLFCIFHSSKIIWLKNKVNSFSSIDNSKVRAAALLWLELC